MTISSETRKAGPFIGNGTASSFPFAFKVFQPSDILAIKLTVSTGVQTTLTLNSDYSVTLNQEQNSNPGGTVVLLNGALASGYTLTLLSNVPDLQPTDLTNQGGFYPEVINDALDRATIQIQQVQEEVSRSIKFPATESGGLPTLPALAQRANTVLAFDALGNPIAGPDIGSLATVSGAIGSIVICANNIASINNASANINSISNFGLVYIGPRAVDPTVRVDNTPLQAGDLYFNTAVNELRVYTGTMWVNNEPSNVGQITGIDRFTGDGLTVNFSLGSVPVNEDHCLVYIGGLYQNHDTYSVSGSTLTFSEAPLSGNEIEVVIFDAVSDAQLLSGDAVTKTFSLAVAPGGKNNTQVFVDGIYQQKNTYAVFGTSLTFSEAPPAGTDNIEVVVLSL